MESFNVSKCFESLRLTRSFQMMSGLSFPKWAESDLNSAWCPKQLADTIKLFSATFKSIKKKKNNIFKEHI